MDSPPPLRWLISQHIGQRVKERLNTRRFKFPDIGKTIRVRYCGVRGWAWFSDYGVTFGTIFMQDDGTYVFVAKTAITRQQFFANVEPSMWRFPKIYRSFVVFEVVGLNSLSTNLKRSLQTNVMITEPPEWTEVAQRLALETETKAIAKKNKESNACPEWASA